MTKIYFDISAFGLFSSSPKSKSTPVISSSTTSKIKLNKSGGSTAGEKLKLFEYFNDEKVNKYMPKVCHILQEGFQEMQQTAIVFYKKSYTIEDFQDLPPTFNDFMIGVLQKYKYYYLQCLQVWAQEIQDLMKLTKELLLFAHQYCENYLQYIHNKEHDTFNEKQKVFFTNIDNAKHVSIGEIQNVHNQLKPLHGYHRNEELLINLNTQMEYTISWAQNDFEMFLEPFDENLKDSWNDYKTKMEEANYLINDFKGVLYDEDFCENLILQAKKIIIYSINVDDHFNMDFEYILNYSQKDSETDTENSLAVVIDNIEDDIRIQILNEEVRLYEEQIQIEKDNFYSKIDSMLQIWNIDMEKVKDLYTLKYE